MNEYDWSTFNTLNFDIIFGSGLQANPSGSPKLSEKIIEVLVNKKFDISKINERLDEIKNKDETDNHFSECAVTFIYSMCSDSRIRVLYKYYYGDHKFENAYYSPMVDVFIIIQHDQEPKIYDYKYNRPLLRKYFDAGLCYDNYCDIIEAIIKKTPTFIVNGPLHETVLVKIKRLEQYWYIYWAIKNGLDKNGVLCKDVYYWIMKMLTQFF